jgi:hypothetical protein
VEPGVRVRVARPDGTLPASPTDWHCAEQGLILDHPQASSEDRKKEARTIIRVAAIALTARA